MLTVRNLRVGFASGGTMVTPVDGVSFDIARGETLALVGESGCGKSLTSLALLRLLPPPGEILPGSAIHLDGEDILALKPAALRSIRGGRIGMIFQDPMTSLNPVLTVGSQVAEAITAHEKVSRQQARERVLSLFEEVGIPDPSDRYGAYPHQLSGGLRQRVMIAIALAAEPDLLLADEPTTALDVTVQAQILELLDRLRESRGMGILLITHDLGIVAGRADRIAVMYAGQIVEAGTTTAVFANPGHPYTRGLFGSIPSLTGPRARLSPIPGVVPQPNRWPSGCRFHPRCPEVMDRCSREAPVVSTNPQGGSCRCWLVAEDQ
jgi:oligopeptide/dipeptide ABC transporter ATP-binding protein